jgi:hypothetical protein
MLAILKASTMGASLFRGSPPSIVLLGKPHRTKVQWPGRQIQAIEICERSGGSQASGLPVWRTQTSS